MITKSQNTFCQVSAFFVFNWSQSVIQKTSAAQVSARWQMKLLVLVHTLQDSVGDFSSLRGNCWLLTGRLKAAAIDQTWVRSFSRMLNSFLPPYFGLLDGSEVRVVYHIVLVALCRGNNAVGRKHGVLLVSTGIILDDRQEEECHHECSCDIISFSRCQRSSIVLESFGLCAHHSTPAPLYMPRSLWGSEHSPFSVTTQFLRVPVDHQVVFIKQAWSVLAGERLGSKDGEDSEQESKEEFDWQNYWSGKKSNLSSLIISLSLSSQTNKLQPEFIGPKREVCVWRKGWTANSIQAKCHFQSRRKKVGTKKATPVATMIFRDSAALSIKLNYAMLPRTTIIWLHAHLYYPHAFSRQPHKNIANHPDPVLMLQSANVAEAPASFPECKLTLIMLPAVLSLSVWSSCSDESVSSKAWSSSSDGKRALR